MNYEILIEEFESKFRSDRTELTKIDELIAKNNQRILNAQSLMLDAEISASDYKEIKSKITQANDDLLRKKANLSSGQVDFRTHLKVGATLLRDIDGSIRVQP